MAEAIAEKESKAPQLSPEEKKKEETAAELLKELAEEEKPGEDDDKPGSESKEDEKGESEGEDADDSERDSQPEPAIQKKKGKRGFKKRQARLVKQREEAREERDGIADQLESEREEKRLLRMRIEQLQNQPKPLTEPDPNSFDGGEIDPDYLTAKREYDQSQLKQTIKETVAQENQRHNETLEKDNHARSLKRKQEQHWENADDLGASDYDEAEEQAVKIIGGQMINHIIDNFPGESHKVIYYLGKNLEEAEDIAELLADSSTLVKGIAEIGKISAKQTVIDPVSPTTPNPDGETEGSSPSHLEALQSKLDKLIEEATTGRKDGMRRIRDFKKKLKERGITL